MQEPVIGRRKERDLLEAAFQSPSSELIALYGRRRVGKTYLIRNTFSGRENTLYFSVTGMKDGSLRQHLENFQKRISAVFYRSHSRLETPKSWFEALDMLAQEIKASPARKIVLFFDEFPWMITRKSELLTAFEYFWNEHMVSDKRVKGIICGSSAGWMVKNIVNNRGAFYNRVTRKIRLEPYNLQQTKEFLTYKKIRLTDNQIAHIYMVLGGIPYYLSQVQPGLSSVQIVANLAFQKESFLLEEFENLYATLFDDSNEHVELARLIAAHRHGISQVDLSKNIKRLKSGGTLVKWLKDLEQAGFIERFLPYQAQKKGVYYKLIDEYSLFYFRWIEPIKDVLQSTGMRKEYWEDLQDTQAWHSWAGYAFESLCHKHVFQIMDALALSASSFPYSWRFVPKDGKKEDGAQIDLLFDRPDDAITLCEIKYTNKAFVIDKPYAERLKKKIEVFRGHTKTDKQLLLAFVSAHGVKDNTYYQELISGICTLKDLFKYAE